jgi:small subunit ribosomal protein S6e
MLVTFKLNIGDPKSGKTTTVEVKEPEALSLIGKKIGEVVDGSLLGLEWKKLLITGGSDKSGIPMRPDIEGPRKTYILTGKGIGLKTARGKTKKGYRKRILVRGNQISSDIYQINMKIIE